MISISEDGALKALLRAIQGAEMFSGFKDEDRFNRPDDKPYFNQDTCEIVALGKCSRPGTSRVVTWELLPPESEEDGNDFPEPT